MSRHKGVESINCACRMKQPVVVLGVLDKHQPCKTCGKLIHSSYWYKATELQRLARERNWDIVQVKGAINALCRISVSRGHPNIPFQFKFLQDRFIDRINSDWREKRMCEQFKIDAAKEKKNK